jgi:ABC-type multidrug transport system fused ATPase/permease subunit
MQDHAQSLAFFHRHKVGELLHRATNDVSVFGDHATELASDLPFDLLTVAGVLGLMLWLDPRLTALVAAFLAASSLFSWRIGRPLPTIRRSLQQIGARLSARLQEGLAGARTVRAFGNQRREIELLDTENQEMRRLELSGERLEAWIVPVFDLMEILGIIVVAWYGGHLILAKRLTPGGLVAFIAYMEILAGPVSRISRYYRHLQGCRAVGARLVESLADRDELPAGRGLTPAGAAASVVLEHVSFRYPGAERDALADVSFEVEPGQVVAVVGRNGAGKSTLIDVILRLHDPTVGHVLLGGLDLRDWVAAQK